jgi:hypothetical protein
MRDGPRDEPIASTIRRSHPPWMSVFVVALRIYRVMDTTLIFRFFAHAMVAIASLCPAGKASAGDDVRIAEVLKPIEEPAAALLDSGLGMSLAEYAALDNEIQWADDSRKGAVLDRYKLDSQRYARIVETFRTRKASEPALFDYYEAHYFRATRGRFATYGQDIADSYEKGRPLQLDPPMPLTDVAMIQANLRAARHSADERQTTARILEQRGISYYDFLVVDGWWERKGAIAAKIGDESIWSAFFAAEDAVSGRSAGTGRVHGENTVRSRPKAGIGGKAAGETDEKH